MDQIWDRNPS